MNAAGGVYVPARRREALLLGDAGGGVRKKRNDHHTTFLENQGMLLKGDFHVDTGLPLRGSDYGGAAGGQK